MNFVVSEYERLKSVINENIKKIKKNQQKIRNIYINSKLSKDINFMRKYYRLQDIQIKKKNQKILKTLYSKIYGRGNENQNMNLNININSNKQIRTNGNGNRRGNIEFVKVNISNHLRNKLKNTVTMKDMLEPNFVNEQRNKVRNMFE